MLKSVSFSSQKHKEKTKAQKSVDLFNGSYDFAFYKGRLLAIPNTYLDKETNLTKRCNLYEKKQKVWYDVG